MNIGSVSSATMRPEDLIPAFVYELKHQKPLRREHGQLVREIETRMDAEGYYDGEEADWDLEALFAALDEYAAPYFYFGAHPGDGAGYGFWLSESFEHDFDGLKVADTADIPKGYAGEVLQVNDHGNMTLYRVGGNGHKYEVWGLV